MTLITRHFATVDVSADGTSEGEQCQVHYRRTGSGPPLLMLHMSPRSSVECEPLMRQWADRFTIIAPDTPGYGASDPFSHSAPSGERTFALADFAHALAAFADAIGLKRFGLYGHHTGAMIAAEFARLYPDRATMTVANGFLVVTDEERAEILANYFHDYTPQPDGQHMAHLWRRIRDQFLYFPWSLQTTAARERMKTKFTIPEPHIIQDDLLDLLRTGKHEADGYGAAFRCNGVEILKGISSPCMVTAQPNDLLYEHLDRIPDEVADRISVERFGDLDSLNAAAKQRLLDRAEGNTPPVTETEARRDQAWRSYADTVTGQLCIKRSLTGAGLPVVLIHNLGSSTNAWQPVVKALSGKRPFVAFDLPGHGETGSAWGDGPVTVEACAQAIDEAMTSLSIEACHVFSYGGGGLVALKLLDRKNHDIRSWTAVDFWLFDTEERAALEDRLAPALKPQPYGEHLNEAWYMVRDGELFWPWFDSRPGNAVDQPPETDPARLHRKVCDILKAAPVYQTVVNSALEVDAAPILKTLTIPVTFGPRDGSPHTHRCQRAAELTPKGKAITLSNDHARRAAAVVALLRD